MVDLATLLFVLMIPRPSIEYSHSILFFLLAFKVMWPAFKARLRPEGLKEDED